MGILKGTSEGFGLLSLASDLGLTLTLSIKTDSSAAVGICKRTGIGRVRHLAVGQLWIQDRLRNGAFKFYKYLGNINAGDLLTKHVTHEEIVKHDGNFGHEFRDGRAASAPQVITRGK